MKFFKVIMLLCAFASLWGINSFAFSEPIFQPEVKRSSQEINTHIIPLMVIDGQFVRVTDLMDSVNYYPY
jgi:hypothetical protein